MCNYSEPLDKDGWSEHYNISSLHQVIDSIKDGTVQIWAKELCHIISENESCLEIRYGLQNIIERHVLWIIQSHPLSLSIRLQKSLDLQLIQ